MSVPLIVELPDAARLDECLEVIHASFGTVAAARGLTQETAPTHPAFWPSDKLRSLRQGSRWFAAMADGHVVGFAALVPSPRPEVAYLEKLAVLGSERHGGLGRALVERVAEEALASGADILSIAIIDDEDVLKRWYEGQGFAVTHTKDFDHLPFTVCVLDRTLSGGCSVDRTASDDSPAHGC